ncbi:MAG: cyclic pyranopterin monophosphate synthase MoaC [Polyangiaceae bacterium]|nr:cyclic pyranopterin monophosphate synthase MoaC [Polyangiaceae bacterium]
MSAAELSGVLFDFDEAGADLELIPLAARRALDHAGLRLSRAGWQSLPLDARRTVVELGAADSLDASAVRAAVAVATPAPEPQPQLPEPSLERVPQEIPAALDGSRPLGHAQWLALSPLARYALHKVAASRRPERTPMAYDELVAATGLSTHLSAKGEARMVGVGDKPIALRRAVAESSVTLGPVALERLTQFDAKKGDVLAAARLAGIQAAKRTSELIPLCHLVALTRVAVELEVRPERSAVEIRATAEAIDRTGVEMEALVAASVAALTVYDMLKSSDRGMVIGPTRLLEKSGGRTGEYSR